MRAVSQNEPGGSERNSMRDREEIFTHDRRLSRVKQYVEKNLSEPLPLKTVAKVAGLDPKYFSTFFHRHVGMCYRDWLAGMRVRDAAERIATGPNESLARIAFSVGFQSVRAFQRAFKQHMAVTPREYKTSVRQRANFTQVRPLAVDPES